VRIVPLFEQVTLVSVMVIQLVLGTIAGYLIGKSRRPPPK